MKLLKRMLREDNRGLSMVELICSVAILGVISTAIGGAMIVTSDSYKRGTTETTLQQEAQFAANAISEMIVDVTEDVTFAGGVLTINNQVWDADSNSLVPSVCTITLSGTDLTYSMTAGGVTDSGILASGVTSFDVDCDDFAASRNAIVTIQIERDGKTIESNYTITSRNEPDATAAAAVNASAVIECESMLTLEPHQEYSLPFTVRTSGGASSIVGCSVSDNTAASTSASVDNTNGLIMISIADDEKGNGGTIYLNLQTTDGVGSKTVVVNIRRVNTVTLSDSKPTLVSGTGLKAGAIYELNAATTGTNFAKVVGATYDFDYVNPNGVAWSFSNSSLVPTSSILVATDSYVKFKLARDMTSGETLTVTAKAKHPDGANKTSHDYGDALATATLRTSGPFTQKSDFLRGDDNTDTVDEHVDYEAIKTQFGGNKPMRRWRVREIEVDAAGNFVRALSEWDAWWNPMVDEGTGGNGKLFIRPQDIDLNPGKSYEWQIQARYGDGVNATWHIHDDGSEVCEECTSSFIIPAGGLRFTKWTGNGESDDFLSSEQGIGTKNHKFELAKDAEYLFDYNTIAVANSKYVRGTANMQFIVDRWNGSNWELGISGYGDSIQVVLPDDSSENKGKIQLKFRVTGEYRVRIDWDNSTKTNWGIGPFYDSNVMNLSTENGDQIYKGVFYFKIEEPPYTVRLHSGNYRLGERFDCNQYLYVNLQNYSNKTVRVTKDGVATDWLKIDITNQIHYYLSDQGCANYDGGAAKGRYDVEILYEEGGTSKSVGFVVEVE